jgi:hypothetical protein
VAVSSSNGLVSGVLLRRYRLRPSAALSSSTVRVWPHFTRGRPQHLTFLRDRMKGRRAVKVSLHQQVGGGALEIFRADAKAEGDDVCIGGWEVRSLEGEVVDTMGRDGSRYVWTEKMRLGRLGGVNHTGPLHH